MVLAPSNATTRSSMLTRPTLHCPARVSRVTGLTDTSWPIPSAPPHQAPRQHGKSTIGGGRHRAQHDQTAQHLACLHILVCEIDAVGKTCEGASQFGSYQSIEGDADRRAQTNEDSWQRRGKDHVTNQQPVGGAKRAGGADQRWVGAMHAQMSCDPNGEEHAPEYQKPLSPLGEAKPEDDDGYEGDGGNRPQQLENGGKKVGYDGVTAGQKSDQDCHRRAGEKSDRDPHRAHTE